MGPPPPKRRLPVVPLRAMPTEAMWVMDAVRANDTGALDKLLLSGSATLFVSPVPFLTAMASGTVRTAAHALRCLRAMHGASDAPLTPTAATATPGRVARARATAVQMDVGGRAPQPAAPTSLAATIRRGFRMAMTRKRWAHAALALRIHPPCEAMVEVVRRATRRAGEEGDLPNLRALLQHLAPWGATLTWNHYAPLHGAVSHRQGATVTYMLAHIHASINRTERNGAARGVAHRAVAQAALIMIAAADAAGMLPLVLAGAPLPLDGRDAATLAWRMGHTETLRALLEAEHIETREVRPTKKVGRGHRVYGKPHTATMLPLLLVVLVYRVYRARRPRPQRSKGNR